MEPHLLLWVIAQELRRAYNYDSNNNHCMNQIRLRTRQSALFPLSTFLLTVCFYLAGLASANSQIAGGISTTPRSAVPLGNSISNLQFSPFLDYDAGGQSSIALNAGGIALEFHRSQNDNTIWYR